MINYDIDNEREPRPCYVCDECLCTINDGEDCYKVGDVFICERCCVDHVAEFEEEV